MKNKQVRGFTVLELLIVIAIMCILIGLILVGLNAARSHSRDQNKVAAIQNIVIGIDQFHDICRSYPSILDPNDPASTCAALGNKTIADFIPNLDSYHFNQAGSDYVYAGLSSDGTDCTDFHIGVTLEGDTSSYSPAKKSFGPSTYSAGMSACQGAPGGSPATDFDGTVSTVFDIEQ